MRTIFKFLWSLFTDEVQLSQGHSATTRKLYFLMLISQAFVVLIWSTSEGYMAVPTLDPPSGVEQGTPGMRIQRLND